MRIVYCLLFLMQLLGAHGQTERTGNVIRKATHLPQVSRRPIIRKVSAAGEVFNQDESIGAGEAKKLVEINSLGEVHEEKSMNSFGEALEKKLPLAADFSHGKAFATSMQSNKEDKDKAARFLMSATFGPTRKTVDNKIAIDDKQWVQQQMALPMTSHRKYFRQRTSPESDGAFAMRGECDKGSRWSNAVFNANEASHRYKVRVKNGNEIWIDKECNGKPCSVFKSYIKPNSGQKCTDILPPADKRKARRGNAGTLTRCSQIPSIQGRNLGQSRFCRDRDWHKNKWCQKSCYDAGVAYFNIDTDREDDCSGGWSTKRGSGYHLCHIGFQSRPGGQINLCNRTRCEQCKKEFLKMANVEVWGQPNTAEVALALFQQIGDDLILKQEAKGDICTKLNKKLVKVGQKYYVSEPRGELMFNDNAVYSPPSGQVCTPMSIVNKDACKIGTGKCSNKFSCGSPFEVKNNPFLGHRFPVQTWPYNLRFHRGAIYLLDSRRNMPAYLGKSIVWTSNAISSQDQLCQRVAWALSQILVVGVGGFPQAELETEPWLAYYDIMVRNCFGNYEQILTEVTYSPVMANYLTFLDTEAFDKSGKDPDENYAREIMQLFTVGPELYKKDGTKAINAMNESIATYSTDNIRDLARVFTGFKEQAYRSNIEAPQCLVLKRGSHDLTGTSACAKAGNHVDPLQIIGGLHDVYPKPNILGGYLGDGYPLCADLPQRHHLQKNAAYEYHPLGGNARQLSSTGKLYKVLKHTTKASVRLSAPITCSGSDCQPLSTGDFVRAGSRVFRYIMPTCVRPYFPDGQKEQKLYVWPDGRVSVTDKYKNSFPVHWTKKPAFESQTEVVAKADASAVFSKVPSAKQVVQELFVAALAPPTTTSQHEHGQGKDLVKAYGEAFDGSMVFEVGGKYYKNIKLNVRILDGNFKFRNPPTFIMSSSSSIEIAAHNEVGSLVQHLLHHRNTPYNFCRKMIQRLVMSSPPLNYLRDVAEAFRSGTYDGLGSGKYGDMKALVAAILLHPEAQKNDRTSSGVLREPMLKIIHLLRALEYQDEAGEPFLLYESVTDIGQFPFFSPTVFNFYDSDFMPMLSEPEPEPEPESEAEGGLVAPEFQIMTPPYMINLVNGLLSTVDHGISSCDAGFGLGHSCKAREADVVQFFVSRSALKFLKARCPAQNVERGSIDFQKRCSHGKFNLAAPTLEQLDTLLTGGRLTPKSTAVLKGMSGKTQQKALLLTPEFHTLGAPLPTNTKRPAKPSTGGGKANNYKAMVLLMFAGGADGFSLLVPLSSCKVRTNYQTVRRGYTLAEGDLKHIHASAQAGCQKYGIHPSMPHLFELYKEGNAAFVANIGALVSPTTKLNMAGACPNIASHNHYQTFAQTMNCAGTGLATGAGGVGGKMADVLAKGKGWQTSSFSIAGRSAWTDAVTTKAAILAGRNGVITLSAYSTFATAIEQMTENRLNNTIIDEYSIAFKDAIAESQKFHQLLKSADTNPKQWDPKASSFSRQLYQVAKLIRTRTQRKANRDFFWVVKGGWDHHRQVGQSLPGMLKEVDNAISWFVKDLKAAGTWDKTILMTTSEFGRTTTINNNAGFDHGWASNHFLVGGDLKKHESQGNDMKGNIHNQFAASYSDGPHVRGRHMIPVYPWESVAVPIAKWLGVDKEADLAHIFPNLKNFNNSQQGGSFYIIPEGDLFESMKSSPTTRPRCGGSGEPPCPSVSGGSIPSTTGGNSKVGGRGTGGKGTGKKRPTSGGNGNGNGKGSTCSGGKTSKCSCCGMTKWGPNCCLGLWNGECGKKGKAHTWLEGAQACNVPPANADSNCPGGKTSNCSCCGMTKWGPNCCKGGEGVWKGECGKTEKGGKAHTWREGRIACIAQAG